MTITPRIGLLLPWQWWQRGSFLTVLTSKKNRAPLAEISSPLLIGSLRP